VRFQNEIIKQKKFEFDSMASPELRADFDQDMDVDFNDLILLARNLGKKANLFQALSLFDLNQDEIINEVDFVRFKDFFGFPKSPQP